VDNSAIAERLDSFAVLLELAGSGRYTARAYRRAAETIRETRAPVEDLVRAGRVQELRGIGAGIAGRLEELVETGTIAELDELEATVNPELVGLGRLLGFGPERMLEITRALGVGSVEEFREAVSAGRLEDVAGVGPKTQARVIERLEAPVRPERRGLTLNRARELVSEVAEALGGEVAGDPRRWADVSFELSVVVASDQPGKVLRGFETLPPIVALVERESRRALGVTVDGVPIELIVAERERFGTELLRATGTREYVSALGPLPAAADEAAVYEALGLPWCPPELREEPFRGKPPPLVELADVLGDLHCHTTWSDGRASVLDMAAAARDLGYE
jgi:DNA polymerase (family X)